ncbi:MAG: hypothetical protein PHW34_13270 [Hespellia sp.]|nr:hypothetical protein [Hespellia sp.]
MARIKKFETFGLALLLSTVMFISGFGTGIYVAAEPQTEVKASSSTVKPQKLTIVTPSKLKDYNEIHIVELKADGEKYQEISARGYIVKNVDGTLDVVLLTEIE